MYLLLCGKRNRRHSVRLWRTLSSIIIEYLQNYMIAERNSVSENRIKSSQKSTFKLKLFLASAVIFLLFLLTQIRLSVIEVTTSLTDWYLVHFSEPLRVRHCEWWSFYSNLSVSLSFAAKTEQKLQKSSQRNSCRNLQIMQMVRICSFDEGWSLYCDATSVSRIIRRYKDFQNNIKWC